MESQIVNIPQLEFIVETTIRHYNIMLDDEIRTLGLRRKIIKRKETLMKIIKILSKHKD